MEDENVYSRRLINRTGGFGTKEVGPMESVRLEKNIPGEGPGRVKERRLSQQTIQQG